MLYIIQLIGLVSEKHKLNAEIVVLKLFYSGKYIGLEAFSSGQINIDDIIIKIDNQC